MEFGDLKLFSLSDGYFRLDGGAMFGLVPRLLWEKEHTPDEKNRILLGLNPLLIQKNNLNILVDTGISGKGDKKFHSIYGIERDKTLHDSLVGLGLEEEDINIVINTHLHFDHAGGNTVEEGNTVKPAFPEAKYIVQAGEWEEANNPNERTKASYRPEDFIPVMEAGQFELIEGDQEIVEGIRVFKTSGHNRHIQLVRIESGDMVAVFLSDIIPTTSHLYYSYIMGYDLFPLDTLKVKKEIIQKAACERWLLIFEHDPEVRMGYVRVEKGRPLFKKVE